MSKFFNFRPLFVGFVSLILGIICLTNYLYSSTAFNLSMLVLFCVVLVACVAFVLLTTFKFKSLKNYNMLAIVFVGFACLGFLVGIINYYSTMPTTYTQNVEVVGEINEIYEYDNSSVINLANISINGDHKIGGLQLTVFSAEQLEIGDSLKFVTEVVALPKTENNIVFYLSNVNYVATISYAEVTKLNTDLSFDLQIKNNVADMLNENLNSENASIAYSMLFGESENLNFDTRQSFDFAGLSHLLAVSGLHVGFLVTLLYYLLNKLKANKLTTVLTILGVLLIYALLCNFSVSVMRAVIMSMVLIFSRLYGKQYDSLSALSLAGIIVLAIFPLNIYSVGFQLSFICVFSIICLSPLITKLFNKIKFPKLLSTTLSMSIAVNIGVLTIMAQHFNLVNLVSIFSNILVIPIFSVAYILLFCIVVLNLIFPFLSVALYIPDLFLHAIKLLAEFFSYINVLNFTIMHFSYVLVFASIVLIYFLGFAIVKSKLKSVVIGAGAIVIILSAILLNVPITHNNLNTSSYTSSGNYAIYSNDNNTLLVVNSVYDYNKIIEEANKNKIDNIDQVFINNYTTKFNELVIGLGQHYNIQNVYVESSVADVAYSTISKYVFVKSVTNNFVVYDYEIEIYYNNYFFNSGFSVTNQTSDLFINDTSNKIDIQNIVAIDDTFNNVFANLSYNYSDLGLNFNNYITNKSNKYAQSITYLYNV